MTSNDPDRLPPGRQPYDRLVGLRVGAIAGGLAGGVAGVLVGTPWLLLLGAVLGAAVGYLTERRRVAGETRELRGDPPSDGG